MKKGSYEQKHIFSNSVLAQKRIQLEELFFTCLEMGRIASEMSDTIKDLAALKQIKKAERKMLRDSSPDKLKAAGIAYLHRNFGAHLIVMHNKQIVDFWPGTEKWRFRNSEKTGSGIENLIQQLKA